MGFSPGAVALLMTVRAFTWVTERTVAAVSQGRPKSGQIAPKVTIRSRSRWKPEPLIKRLSFLLTIKLQTGWNCWNEYNEPQIWLHFHLRLNLTSQDVLQRTVHVMLAYSRGDLSLHEYEDKNKQGRDHWGPHHPNWKRLFISKWTDKPAPFVRRCDRETRGDVQLLQPQKHKRSYPRDPRFHWLQRSAKPTTL